MDCGALLVVLICSGNDRPAGASVTAETPVPVSEITCGLPGAVSETLRFAARDPPTDGVNVTLIVQFAPPASVAGQLFVWLKLFAFAPVKLIPPICIGVVPVLVSVAICAGLLRAITVGLNASDGGVRLAMGTITNPATLRIRLLPVSAISIAPRLSIANDDGECSCALSAGPPSPLNPAPIA